MPALFRVRFATTGQEVNKMDCEKVQKWLKDPSQIPEAEYEQLIEHVFSCGNCRGGRSTVVDYFRVGMQFMHTKYPQD